MKLFCPNCQKELIIEDRFAGQKMSCPLCQSTFTAPVLTNFSTRPPESPPASPPEEPVPAKPGPEPAKQEAEAETETKPAPEPASLTDYRRLAFTLRPEVIQWVPVSAMFFVGILTWFTWVWIGYGSQAVFSQNGVEAAFGSVSRDLDLVPKGADEKNVFKKISTDGAGFSLLTLFFLFVLFGAFVLSALVAALQLLPVQLPPQAKMILPWKWAIVAVVILFALLVFWFQLFVGFPLQNTIANDAGKSYQTALENQSTKEASWQRDIQLASIHRTGYVSTIAWLHIIAIFCAGIMFLNDFRKDAPPPRLDVLW